MRIKRQIITKSMNKTNHRQSVSHSVRIYLATSLIDSLFFTAYFFSLHFIFRISLGNSPRTHWPCLRWKNTNRIEMRFNYEKNGGETKNGRCYEYIGTEHNRNKLVTDTTYGRAMEKYGYLQQTM